MRLTQYLAERYELKRNIREPTAKGYRYTVQSLCRYAGGDLDLGDLNPDLVNGWLRSVAGGVSPTTLGFFRRHLLILWRSAAEDELCQPPAAWRIRKVKTPPRIPEAWTVDEVRLLAHWAKRLEGDYPALNVRRSYFWQLAIRFAWDEGLRWGDLLNQPPNLFRKGQLRATLIQSKTGMPVIVGCHESTWSFRAAVTNWPRLVWWPHCQRYFATEFASIVKLAKLRGSFIKIRKSSGSDVEKNCPGFGSMHLGHSLGPRVSIAYYFDPRIVTVDKPLPTEL